VSEFNVPSHQEVAHQTQTADVVDQIVLDRHAQGISPEQGSSLEQKLALRRDATFPQTADTRCPPARSMPRASRRMGSRPPPERAARRPGRLHQRSAQARVDDLGFGGEPAPLEREPEPESYLHIPVLHSAEPQWRTRGRRRRRLDAARCSGGAGRRGRDLPARMPREPDDPGVHGRFACAW